MWRSLGITIKTILAERCLRKGGEEFERINNPWPLHQSVAEAKKQVRS